LNGNFTAENRVGVIYIVSIEKGAGKTAICAGLATNLLNSGRKAAYERLPGSGAAGADVDTGFMKKIPGLLDGASGADITLVEAALSSKASDAGNKSVYKAAGEAKAKVVAVETYGENSPDYTEVYKGFTDNLLGVIVNKVPQSQVKRVKEEAVQRFTAAGTKVLGVIPENRVLLAITVGELAEAIAGTVISNSEQSGEIIENYMLGAMVVDSGLTYFGRKNNKAAIIRQDRPDMQLAALETSTACLVLSGSKEPPIYNVMNKAAEKKVPIISTFTAVNDIVSSVEKALFQLKLNQEKKLTKISEIVRQNLDMKIFG
jgi:BioD-like phosphotransacetylase family protein